MAIADPGLGLALLFETFLQIPTLMRVLGLTVNRGNVGLAQWALLTGTAVFESSSRPVDPRADPSRIRKDDKH